MPLQVSPPCLHGEKSMKSDPLGRPEPVQLLHEANQDFVLSPCILGDTFEVHALLATPQQQHFPRMLQPAPVSF